MGTTIVLPVVSSVVVVSELEGAVTAAERDVDGEEGEGEGEGVVEDDVLLCELSPYSWRRRLLFTMHPPKYHWLELGFEPHASGLV